MKENIIEIYEKYKIMPNLQEHMLRVAAVASIICDNLDEPVEKEQIITVCLLHDMGNIIKAEFGVFPPDFWGEKDLTYWQEVKNEYIKKYGNNEHEVTAQIIKEIGMNAHIVQLADRNRFSFTCDIAEGNDLIAKIIKYSDFRAGPYGILSYEERMNEANNRYKKHINFFEKEKRQKLVECGRKIEKQIFARCKIKPEDINDESVKSIILELKNFVI